jgi:hypothetical protein
MRRRREQRGARPVSIASPKVSNKLKQKQQGLTNGKSENEETVEQPITTAGGGQSNKKSN